MGVAIFQNCFKREDDDIFNTLHPFLDASHFLDANSLLKRSTAIGRLVLDAVVDNDLRAFFRMHGWHRHHATGAPRDRWDR